MAPVEIFPSVPFPDDPNDDDSLYSWDDLSDAADRVCRRHGLLSVDTEENNQTGEISRKFTISTPGKDTIHVELIGWDGSETGDISAHGEIRPHKLIVPDNHTEILDEVKVEIERAREASKFSTASSSRT